jgi:phosphoglycolate phosphatase
MPSSPYKIVIFDLDGTLVDAYRAVWLSLNVAFKKGGFPRVSFQTVKESVGWGERSLVKKFVPPDQVEETLKIYRASHRKALKQGVRFLPGAKKLLTHLRQRNFKIAIASNRKSEFCELILRTLKVRKQFDIVMCADKVKRPKPDGEMLKEILKWFKLKPSEALYVGDMTIDIQTGRDAKVRTIAIPTGSSKRSELIKEKPFKIIKKISEIQRLV